MVNVGKMLVTSHMGDTSVEVMLEIDGYDAYALSKSNSSDSIKRVVLNAIKNDMFRRALGEPKYIGTLDWGTRHAVPAIDRVIFHDPATIVYWEDGTKTVVKCQREKFDKEKGLLAAIAKKVYGNNGSFNNIIKRFVEE